MKKIKANELDKQANKVYKEAFPFLERVPIHFLNRKIKIGKFRIYKYFDGEQFVGISIFVLCNAICYLYFLAVDKNQRNLGYGTQILNDLKKEFYDKKIILCAEYAGKGDCPIKSRRINFYIRNGFVETGIKFKEATILYSLLCFNGDVSFDEYKTCANYVLGKFYARMFLRTKEIK